MQPPNEAVELLGPNAAELVTLLPEFADQLPSLAPETMLDPEQEKRRLFQALLHFFTRLSTFQPLLVIIEDIHWSDDNSLQFLLFLARHLAPHPILLLLTYRSEEDHPALLQFLAGLDRERLTTELALSHLTIDEVEVLFVLYLVYHALSVQISLLRSTHPPRESFFHRRDAQISVASGEIVYGDGKLERRSSEMGTAQVHRYPTFHISHAAHCLPYSSVYIA